MIKERGWGGGPAPICGDRSDEKLSPRGKRKIKDGLYTHRFIYEAAAVCV